MDHNAFLKMFLMPVKIHKARMGFGGGGGGIGMSPAKRLLQSLRR